MNIGMARKIKVVVETGRDLFACFMTGADDLGFGIHGDGKTARKAIEDFCLARDEMAAFYQEQGKAFPELEFEFVFDIGAFFSYYPINVTAFAEYAGMNASQLRQYACGLRTPTEKSIKKIKEAIDKVVSDIGAGRLIDRPVLQYI